MSMAPAQSKTFRLSQLRRVFTFAAPYKKKFFISLFLSVFLAALAPVRPLLIQVTINKGLAEGVSSWIIDGPGGFIIEVTIIQIVLLLLETACRFWFTFSTASLGQSVVKDLRVSTYRKILNLNLSQFDQTPIGTLTTRTINDIESVNEIFSDGLIPIIADLLSIASILTYMFWVDWKLTLVCMAPFPFMIVATYFFKETVNKSFIKVRNAVAALNAYVQEHITGMFLVQALHQKKESSSILKKLTSSIAMPTSRPSLLTRFSSRWWNWFLHSLLVYWCGGPQRIHWASPPLSRRRLVV